MAVGFYETSLTVGLLASLDGVLTTLPLLLVIVAGILLSSLLMDTGSLVRIVDWFQTGAGNAMSRNMLITFGVGNFMEGSGVIAEPVLAPMLRAAGVSPTGAAALSIIGFISSPFKIALATSMVGAVGSEGKILRITIPLGIGVSFMVGLVVWLAV